MQTARVRDALIPLAENGHLVLQGKGNYDKERTLPPHLTNWGLSAVKNRTCYPSVLPVSGFLSIARNG